MRPPGAGMSCLSGREGLAGRSPPRCSTSALQHYSIHDASPARAEALATDLKSRFAERAVTATADLGGALQHASGAINATPIGMTGHPGTAIPPELISRGHWIADVVYTPLETRLIAGARAKGCRVMTGGGMCVHQAAEAFRLFTGVQPDAARMHDLFARACAERDARLAAT